MGNASTILQESAIHASSIDDWKAAGKKIVGTICCHVPEELIHAAGMLPVRLRATGCTEDAEAETWMSPFTCSFARSTLQYLIDGKYDFLDGLVASDGCLMAGRIYDNWRFAGDHKTPTDDYYVRMIAVPRLHNHHTLPFYVEHLQALKEGLEKLSGNTITDEKLQASIDLYNETRALIRELYALRKGPQPKITGTETLKATMAGMSMPKEDYNKLLREYIDEVKQREPLTGQRARIMVIGSAIDDPEYFQVIEDQGALIVTDDTCFGSRYLWEPVEVEAGDDLITGLAKSYLNRPVCPRMTDLRDKIHDFILDMVKEYDVDGIIFSKLQFCEIWGGELLFFHEKFEKANIPFLTVEREEIMTNAGQLAVRAEAFIEMIEKEDK